MKKQEYYADWVVRAQKIAHLGIWDQDPVSDELWWSDETFRILGLNPQSIAPSFDKFLQMVHPDDRGLVVQQTGLALKSDDNPYNVEYRIIRPDNSERIVHEEAVIERDEEGTPIKITGIIQDITARKQAEEEREKLINKLQKTLEDVRTLSGMLPICSSCKKIRDDEGYWTQIETYIKNHSEAEFSHSICPDCVKRLYPDLYKIDEERQ